MTLKNIIAHYISQPLFQRFRDSQVLLESLPFCGRTSVSFCVTLCDFILWEHMEEPLHCGTLTYLTFKNINEFQTISFFLHTESNLKRQVDSKILSISIWHNDNFIFVKPANNNNSKEKILGAVVELNCECVLLKWKKESTILLQQRNQNIRTYYSIIIQKHYNVWTCSISISLYNWTIIIYTPINVP